MNQFENIMPESKCILPPGMGVKPFASRAFYVMEIWKDVKEFNGDYSVSSKGRVRSNNRMIEVNNNGLEYNKTINTRIIKPHLNKKTGYLAVVLRKNERPFTRTIHRLVATAFIEKTRPETEVNHRDANKLNNNANNLEWVTRKENVRHSFRHGLNKIRTGSDVHFAVLNEVIVLEIRERYGNIRRQYAKIGDKYNVSPKTIEYIVKRKTWKHI